MFEETKRLVALEKVKVSQESVLITTKYEKVKKIVDRNPFGTISALLDVDVCEIISAYLCAECDFNVEYDDIYNLVDKKIDRLIVGDDKTSFDRYLASSDETNNDNQDIDSGFLAKVKRVRKLAKSRYYDATIKELIKYIGQSKLRDVFCLAQALYELKDARKDINLAIVESEKESGIYLRGKEKAKVLESEIKEDYNIKEIINELSSISARIANVDKRNKSITGKINRTLHDYEIFLSKLNHFSYSSILEIDSALKYCESDDIKKVFLVEYNSILKNNFDKQKEKHGILSNDVDSKYQVLFNNYGANFNEFSDESKLKISTINFENIKAIMDIISIFGFRNADIEYILCNSNLSFVKQVIDWLNKGYFNLQFLFDNVEMFNANNLNVQKIISLLNSLNINPQLFENSGEIYLNDIQNLQENFSIMDGYNLLGLLKNTTNYYFLCVDDLALRIDLILELGYENFLVSNLDLLNYDVIRIKRLYLLKQIGYLPQSIEEIMKVLSTDEFIIPDDKVEDYLEDYSSLIIPDDIKNVLSTNIIVRNNGTTRTMAKNNSICSKNRVFKNKYCLKVCEGLTENQKSYYSFLYGRILTYSEYQRFISDYCLVENSKVL